MTYLRWAEETSDEFIEQVNKLIEAMTNSQKMKVGFEMTARDVFRILFYIRSLETTIYCDLKENKQ